MSDRTITVNGPAPFSAADTGTKRLSWHFGVQDDPSRLARLEVQEVVVGHEPFGFDGHGVSEPIDLRNKAYPVCDRLGDGDEPERAVASVSADRRGSHGRRRESRRSHDPSSVAATTSCAGGPKR